MIDTNKRLLPVFETPAHLEIYDIHDAAYDVQLSVTTLTGLINRGQPRVYLLSNNDAESLFNALLSHVPHEYVSTGKVDTLDAMLKTYRDIVRGMVIYDPTVADLRVHHWKNRLQAYRWAEENLLKEATKLVVAGLNPKIAGGLRSFLVATSAFVYWLNPFNILPDPAAGWTTERCLMKRIIRAFPAGTPHLGWFINEFGGVDMTSKAGLYLLSSDYFYNLEVWTAVQPARIGTYNQGGGKPRPYPVTDEVPHPVQGTGGAGSRPGNHGGDSNVPKIYVSFTISDGDNLQYNQHRMYQLWQDTARGTIPLGWTIAPALVEAAPILAAYYQNTATQNDELVAGASGAAYIWPSSWPASQLSAYLQATGTLMQRMDLRTIEVLDGFLSRLFPYRPWQEQYAKSLSPFGLRGILASDSYRRGGWRVVSGVPVIKNLGLAKSVAHTFELIKNSTPDQAQSPIFLNIYVYAWIMTPTDISKVIQGLDKRYEVVTPGQLCALIAQTQEQK